MTARLRLTLIGLCAVLGIYSLFSFSLTDPNLVLTSWTPYWQFQQWLWQTFFENHQLLTWVYVGLLCSAFGLYGVLLHQARQLKTPALRALLPGVLWLMVPLLFSYNALSHDVFNYLFNAKMVVVYGQNPHLQTAINFPDDLWTRFMHNTHTPAPYGYGWTAISLIPLWVGRLKFSLTWWLFRWWSVLSVGLVLLAWNLIEKQTGQPRNWWWTLAILANPLWLIELISNMHNDLWMLAPAVVSMGLVVTQKKSLGKTLLSSLLLLASIAIKLATVTLLPLWLAIVFQQLVSRWPRPVAEIHKWVVANWALVASMLLMVPLFTLRSQQFLPWYLTWCLVWVPFISQRWWKWGLVVLSISSMVRYVPWLLAGGFSPEIILQQKLITWVPWVIWMAASLTRRS